jgi:hypothetical protein
MQSKPAKKKAKAELAKVGSIRLTPAHWKKWKKLGGIVWLRSKIECDELKMRSALELIATPMRADGTWNRDRAACQELAKSALRDGNKPAAVGAKFG